MAKANYFKAVLVLAAMVVTAMVVAYGSASAQVETNGDNNPPIGSPTVVSTSPKDGATNVDRDANIKVKFSEKMMKSSINFGSFYLLEGFFTDEDLNPPSGGGGEPVEPPPPAPGSKVSYDKKKKLAVLNWGVRLKANTTYTVVVEGAGDDDAFTVKDRGGTEMATDKIWHFTTGAE